MKKLLSIVAAAGAVLLVVVTTTTPTWAARGGGKGGGGKGPDYDIVHLTENILDENGDMVEVFTNGLARGVSDTGVVVGQVEDLSTGEYLAACWTITKSGGSVESTLSLLPGGITAYSVNNTGEAVGQGEDPGGNLIGVYWNILNGTQLVLPPLSGDDRSAALSINENGIVCGTSKSTGVPVTTAVAWRINIDSGSGQAVVWGPVALPTVTSSYAAAVNDNDQNGLAEIVGRHEYDPATATPVTAIVWTVQSNGDGTLQVNSTVPLEIGARASGVNNLGEVCGESDPEAIVWSGGSSTILKRNKFVFNAAAQDINTAGVIVGDGIYQKGFDGPGMRAIVWPSAGSSLILLDKFLAAHSPFHHLSTAIAVNQSGQIVGHGGDGLIDFQGAFLALPK